MSFSDPIADMLTRIRNAVAVKHGSVVIPGSNTKIAMTNILKNEGFIDDFEILSGNHKRDIRIRLKYSGRKESAINGLNRVSKPGLRIYVGKKDIPRIYGGIGVAIISTSQGLMTGSDSWKKGVGGEFLCYIW